MKRTASANWQGTGKEGKGKLSTQSGVLSDTQYSFNTRFADGIGTNPEELLGAAHAGCFTMKLSFNLNQAGFTAENIDTKATVSLENGSINQIDLEVKATVPDISAEQFDELAKDAKANCPVSKLFNTNIILTASLV
ncbi:MAG: OsmC family protein [Chitinophagales bacterium]|nr:OsmC family protein [Chitinophagales bacterium]